MSKDYDERREFTDRINSLDSAGVPDWLPAQ